MAEHERTVAEAVGFWPIVQAPNPLEQHLAALLELAGPGGGAPDHAHARPGHWDSNGRECRECRIWREARAALNR